MPYWFGIRQEEKTESQLASMENQVNRAEKLVKNGVDAGPKRVWFQTHAQRLEEKERFKLASAGQTTDGGEESGGRKGKKKLGENQKAKRAQRNKERKKTKKAGEMTAAERAQAELQKVMLMQARLAKRASKPKTMRLSNDVETAAGPRGASSGKKKGPHFASSFQPFSNVF